MILSGFFKSLLYRRFFQKICKWTEHLLCPHGILLKKLSLNADSYTSKKENSQQYEQTQLFSRNYSFCSNVIFSAMPDFLKE